MSSLEESMRRMVEQVELERVKGTSTIYLLTSPSGGEGVSFVAKKFADQIMRVRDLNVFLFEVPECSGGEQVPEMLQTDFFDELRKAYDVIIVDGGGLLNKSGSLSFLDSCDVSILVIEADKTTRAECQRTIAELKKYGVRPLGAVLNRTTDPIPNWLKKRLGLC